MNDDLVAYVSRRLTDRDRRILDLLYEHRVFTTDQLADAFFGSPTTARHRLTQLHQLRLVQRFAPFVAKGSAPFHYVLDELGDLVVATERGEKRRRRWRQDRALVLSRSQRLAHTVGVNGLFMSLMADARLQPGCRLLKWWSEKRCAGWCEDLVRPDGYGAWREDGRTVEFVVEFDLARLVELPGDDVGPGTANAERILGEVAEFLTGERLGDAGRIVTTLMLSTGTQSSV